MRKYTVGLNSQPDPDTAIAHRVTLASLPEHFEIVEGGPADAILLSSAAVTDGARVAVAADPLFAPETETVLIPAMRFAPRVFAEPMVAFARSTTFAVYDSVIRLDHADDDELRVALLEQLAAVHAISGQALRLTKLARTDSGYLAEAALLQSNAAVALTGVASRSCGPALTLIAASVERRLEIEINDDRTARPTRVQVFDAKGVTQAPLIHQNSRRLIWLAAHVVLGSGAQDFYGGDIWREDLAEVLRMVP
jgi:hypothetical protein